MADRKQSLSSLGRRRLLQYGATLGAAAAMPSFVTVEALAAGKAKVNMQLGWLASNGIMGEVVAKRMGYLQAELKASSSKSRRAGPAWTASLRSPPAGRRAASSPRALR